MRKRILIVDDEEDLTWSVVKGLTKDNLEVLSAHSGSIALDLLAKHRIHLLVTDIRMPGINGLELVSRVQSLFPNVKIILMTAFSSPEINDFIRRFGVFGFMEKPFEINALRQLINQGLKHSTSSLSSHP